MKHPESWAVGQVPWQFFCTLTWANAGSFKRPPSPRRQVCAAFAFLREAARVAGVHFKKSMCCLRHETGEMTGRDHYHCLLSVVSPGLLPPLFPSSSSLGSQWAPLSTCFYLMDYWDKKLRCGHARVRIFAPAEGAEGNRGGRWTGEQLGGVAYTCKDLRGGGRE
jgi:hypothetical protein